MNKYLKKYCTHHTEVVRQDQVTLTHKVKGRIDKRGY